MTGGPITVALLLTLAVQNAIPPFATDMYTPAFPEVTASLGTSAALVGLTLTAFFIGMGIGQIGGGALSDSHGRRIPMIAGGLICTAGAVICAISPTIGVLILGRFFQGLGGGAASAVGRAVMVDLAHGLFLARTMSLLMAIGGLAPMIAPVLGGIVVTHAPWRAVFWFLTGFGVIMALTAWRYVPESLPVDKRHHEGSRAFASGMRSVLRSRVFVGYMLTSSFSSFCMFAYIANSSYVLQDQKGFSPLQFSLFFGANAMVQILLNLFNTKIIGRFQPRNLIAFGLSIGTSGVIVLVLCICVWNTPLVGTCIGFVLVLSGQAFVFGNSSALALSASRRSAGVASAVQGLVQSTANAISAPLASSGGGETAIPMVIVMIIGMSGAWAAWFLVGRSGTMELRN